MAEAARKFEVAETPLYREAPNNIEAELALLGAILVNNDAFYRVSDFLKSAHFYEPLHRKIFEVSAELIRMGKMANPVTIKTFLPADEKVGDMTVAHYLARLAAEAVTVINAADYGRAIYDLATRRALITVGEDMVNIAYDAPVDMSPSEQIEDA
jgi:replicative DNA helicase